MKNCNTAYGLGISTNATPRVVLSEAGFTNHNWLKSIVSIRQKKPGFSEKAWISRLRYPGFRLPSTTRVFDPRVHPGLLKLIAIFLRSQTDDFAESLTKVTLVVKPDLLRDIG